jgi:flavodoxin
MKKLVIFYSLDGNTKFIAENLAKEIGADILELKPEKEISRIEPIKHLWGGKQAFLKETPRLKNYNLNLEDYQIICIGTPVWAYNFSPPLRTFLKENKIKNKKIILFCTCGQAKRKTFNNLREKLEGNEIIGEIEFKNVLKNPEENIRKLNDFLKKLSLF